MSDFGPMKVPHIAKDLGTIEQQCLSLVFTNISEEMEMKIEAMQKEIHELYAKKEFRNEGKMNWKLCWFVVFYRLFPRKTFYMKNWAVRK